MNKLIPKYQLAGKFEEKSDNTRTRNLSVPVVPKERYTPKVTLLQKYAKQYNNKPQAQFSQDNRTSEKKAVDDIKVRDQKQQQQKKENDRYIGAVAYPVGIAVAQAIPGVNVLTNLGLAGLSAHNLLSDNGVKKTWNAFNESRYGDFAKSALGDILDASVVLGGGYGTYKSTISSPQWRTAMYNNITPASYNNKLSWHQNGKIGEFQNALKDYFTFNTKMQEHPKWENTVIEAFKDNSTYRDISPEMNLALRKEAWQLYQGMPRQHKYILNTGRVDNQGNKIFTLNKELIPKEAIQDFVSSGASESRGIKGDLGNYGGMVNLSKNRTGDNFTLTSDDVFDVQPFLDPNRIANSLPKWMRPILFKKSKYSDEFTNKYSYKHQPWIPKWMKELEFGKITGGKPFRSITQYQGKLIDADKYPYKSFTFDDVLKSRQKLMDEVIDAELDRGWFETPEEFEAAKQAAYKHASDYVSKFTDGEIAYKFRQHMNPREYQQNFGTYNAYKHWWK